MQEQKHTPGPWEIGRDDAYPPRYLLTSKGRTFGAFIGWSSDGVTTDEEDAANRNLIAAAPGLLEALLEIKAALEDARKNHGCTSPHCHGCCHLCANIRRASAAIAKAKGRA